MYTKANRDLVAAVRRAENLSQPVVIVPLSSFSTSYTSSCDTIRLNFSHIARTLNVILSSLSILNQLHLLTSSSPSRSLTDIVCFGLFLSSSLLRFSHSYKECFVPLSNQCGILQSTPFGASVLAHTRSPPNRCGIST